MLPIDLRFMLRSVLPDPFFLFHPFDPDAMHTQSALCMTWLGDKIHSIRGAAVVNLAKLTEAFGHQWSTEQIVPKVVALYGHSNYLFRLTSLASIHALSSRIEPSVFQNVMLPVLLKSSQDPVPNIRLRAAKILGIVGKGVEPAHLQQAVKPVLTRMTQDSDRDVKYFAEEALTLLQ